MNDNDKDEKGSRPSRLCPICSKPARPGVAPFCSRRCADVDLSRWLSGVYAIPVTGDDDDEDGDKGSGSGPPGSSEQRG